MRRALAALALLLAIALPARASVNPTNAFAGRWKDARVPDAELVILPKYLESEEAVYPAVYPVALTWKPSADRQISWTMTARFDAASERLMYADGVKAENGGMVWRDARGTLALDEDGRLIWSDARETDSGKLCFVRDITPAPTAQDFADGYFRVVAALKRGAPDAVSEAARVVVRVLEFAEDRELWNTDGAAAQAQLEAAWESLDTAERARFDAAFDDGVSDPADEAFEDYDSLRRVFEDAGVGAEMARLAASPQVRLSWEFLTSATLNMGNIDDGVREDAVG